LVEATTYDPFGKVLSGGTQSRFQYTEKEKDQETGLNYYESRYYGSDIQHFTQPDTVIPDPYNPQELNRYSYADNNPLKYVDPTGHINEILSYNNALNKYYSNPGAATYNNVLTTAANIQKKSGSTSPSGQSGGSNNNSGSKSGGSPTINRNTEPGSRDVLKPQATAIYNFLYRDAINTFNNQNASLGQRGLAGIVIIGNVSPIFKGAKVVDGVIDTSKMFNPDQASLIELAKDAKRTGISSEDADTLLQWSNEYNIIPTLDHRGTTHWAGGDHIRIGPINHIPVN